MIANAAIEALTKSGIPSSTWQFIIGALTGSLSAYLLGLLVSYRRRERRCLSFSVITRLIVKRTDPELSLRYKNRDIESLYSHTVGLKNTGNRPLTKQRVRIRLPKGGEIVHHELQVPPGAECQASFESSQLFFIDFDLLNPDEKCIVGVTVIDSPDSELEVTARAENLVFNKIYEL